MEYISAQVDAPFSAIIYIFQNTGVYVYKEIRAGELVCVRVNDGSHISSATEPRLRGVTAIMGSRLSSLGETVDVLFGPGDLMPILTNAPYKITGQNVYIDWGQQSTYSRFFKISGCDPLPEVFTIKNDGLVLESANRQKFSITLNQSKGTITVADLFERAERLDYKHSMARYKNDAADARSKL